MSTSLEWFVTTTHAAFECELCERAVSSAVAVATSTGSSETSHSDGQHVARVRRHDEQRQTLLAELCETYGTPAHELTRNTFDSERGGYEDGGTPRLSTVETCQVVGHEWSAANVCTRCACVQVTS